MGLGVCWPHVVNTSLKQQYRMPVDVWFGPLGDQKLLRSHVKNMETLHVGNHFRMYSFVDVNAQAKTLINCSPNTSNDCNQLAVLCDVVD